MDQSWTELYPEAEKPTKIKYFHPMDPNAKSIIGTRVDGYVWAVTTDDG